MNEYGIRFRAVKANLKPCGSMQVTQQEDNTSRVKRLSMVRRTPSVEFAHAFHGNAETGAVSWREAAQRKPRNNLRRKTFRIGDGWVRQFLALLCLVISAFSRENVFYFSESVLSAANELDQQEVAFGIKPTFAALP